MHEDLWLLLAPALGADRPLPATPDPDELARLRAEVRRQFGLVQPQIRRPSEDGGLAERT